MRYPKEAILFRVIDKVCPIPVGEIVELVDDETFTEDGTFMCKPASSDTAYAREKPMPIDDVVGKNAWYFGWPTVEPITQAARDFFQDGEIFGMVGCGGSC